MNKDCFWLADDQFARIKPHLPTDTRGKARVDDRRVISGIVHVLKSGGRWIDAPSVYGPRRDSRFIQYTRGAGACPDIPSCRPAVDGLVDQHVRIRFKEFRAGVPFSRLP